MGLFGNSRDMQGLFGNSEGLFGVNPQTQQQVDQYAAMPQQPQREQMSFGDRLRDAFSVLAGVDSPSQERVKQKRKQEEQWALQQQQFENARRGHQMDRSFDIANPAPVNNDTVNDANLLEQRFGKDVADQYLRNHADPVVSIPLGDGRFYNGPRSMMPGTMGAYSAPKPQGPQPGAVIGGHRFKGGNPNDPSAWEAIGGGVSNGTGGFR